MLLKYTCAIVIFLTCVVKELNVLFCIYSLIFHTVLSYCYEALMETPVFPFQQFYFRKKKYKFKNLMIFMVLCQGGQTDLSAVS